MGNGITKFRNCFAGAGEISRRHNIAVILSDPLDEGFGHSFCYIRPDPVRISSTKVHNEDETTTFRSISGASVSANVSTPLSTAVIDTESFSTNFDRAAAFDCSTSFASLPLQPVPRNSVQSGSGNLGSSGPVERGFLSGPIERGFNSGPIEKSFDEKIGEKSNNKRNLIRVFQRLIAKTILRSTKGDFHDSSEEIGLAKKNGHDFSVSSVNLSNESSLNDGDCDEFLRNQNLQWAEGKAGEDRVHVVISEEYGWVFVGIYDGFNGPDAPDYLLSNLYSAVHKELKGLLWNEIDESFETGSINFDKENYSLGNRGLKNNRNLKEQVLKALSRALRKTEESYLEIADKMVDENPELALMGSCVLVMLMKGEDVYMMNVGDSRAVLARTARPELGLWKSNRDLVKYNGDEFEISSSLTSVQLTIDHSTYVEEEVMRIKNDHPDDASAILNDRVKGYLKVTRAFGAGFLKQPRWNDALLEMFRIDYIGNLPYITCKPFLYHHKLGQNDRFLILSSDGLYQYFTNEEVIYEVESFITSFPEGDPAQHLIEEVLFRAAKKAGMNFHELLDIPQGDRRRYHDDVSIIIISLEGRIWHSSV